MPLAPTPERIDSTSTCHAALSGCVVFLQRWMAHYGGDAEAFPLLIAELALPVGIGFADRRPPVLPRGASVASHGEFRALVSAATRVTDLGAGERSVAAKPVWWPLPAATPDVEASGRGAWVWQVGAGRAAMVLCLLAGNQASLAAEPTVPRAMSLMATILALAQRLRDAEGLARVRADGLRREQVRAETLTLELEQAVRTIDSFTALAAHELRTPLSALMLQTDSAARLIGQEPVPIERIGRKVEAIAKQIERLRRLVEDLLDVSRLEDGKLILRREQVDLAELARGVAGRLAEAFARAHTPFAFDIRGPAVGTLDGARIEQVITNLLSNALKYGMGQPVHLGVEPAGDGARIVVRDGGIGIAADQHQHIFSRYGRAVSERDYGGLGLGLWISRQIVHALGGDIEVESSPGRGAVFTARLPLTEPLARQ